MEFGGAGQLFADDFHDDPFGALPVKLTVEDALPGAGVDLAPGNRHDDLVVQQQIFEVGVGVVFSRLVMPVVWFFWCHLLHPLHDVVKEAALLVVDDNGCGDMHGGDKGKAVLDAALADSFFNFAGDRHNFFTLFGVEGEVGGVGFHIWDRSPLHV